jgi:signal transduction histidine kinase/ActR/RegA family two-component response regulator
VYLEPLDKRNRAALGFDMFSEPVRRAAMERARDTGEASASGMIRLVQEIDSDVQPGFLIYVPAYAGTSTPATVEERRAALRGFVYSPFRSGDLLKGIFGADIPGKVAFNIYDGSGVDARKSLYESSYQAKDQREPSLRSQRALFVAGRTWTVALRTTPLFDEHSQQHVTPLVLLSGLAVSLLLAAVTWLETRARAHSERSRAALQRSRQALARANRIKDEFLAMLGHELRNPLGALANAVRVLRLRAPDDPLFQRSLDAAERQLRVQTRLVDDLLDVSRLSTGKIRLLRQKLDLIEVARRAVSDVRSLAKERGHKLVLATPDDALVVDGDPVRLEQVFTNLLSNAIKYTPPGGEVEVRLERDDGQAVVRVRDTGMGISPEALPNIFDLFTQTDVAKARTQGGLGIGLTLVRQLTELHGGAVQAHSTGLDQGSEFVVRLPAVEGMAEAMEPASGPLEVMPRRPELGAQRVLVIEDNPDARQMLADLLTLLGHEVVVAEDGRRGVQVALENRPQLAFVDLGLPELNGYEVARRIREAADGVAPYLVALTGYGQPEDRQRAIEAGFDEHLVKPLDIERLKQVLERAWHRETESKRQTMQRGAG